VVAGDFTLNDWQPAYSLARGALPKEASETTYPNRNNNRGLFAATQFEAKGGRATFALSGETKGIWVNGNVVKPGAEFTVETKPGTNVIVLQLDDVKPADVKLTSGDVAFVLN
jgi:hypothetical protein